MSSVTTLPSGEPCKTPFKRLLWYDEENDVVKACETPLEQKRHKLGLAPIGSLGSRNQSTNLSVPRRKLLFSSVKGKFYTYGLRIK